MQPLTVTSSAVESTDTAPATHCFGAPTCLRYHESLSQTFCASESTCTCNAPLLTLRLTVTIPEFMWRLSRGFHQHRPRSAQIPAAMLSEVNLIRWINHNSRHCHTQRCCHRLHHQKNPLRPTTSATRPNMALLSSPPPQKCQFMKHSRQALPSGRESVFAGANSASAQVRGRTLSVRHSNFHGLPLPPTDPPAITSSGFKSDKCSRFRRVVSSPFYRIKYSTLSFIQSVGSKLSASSESSALVVSAATGSKAVPPPSGYRLPHPDSFPPALLRVSWPRSQGGSGWSGIGWSGLGPRWSRIRGWST